VKDLRVLGRKLENVLLVDNAPYSYLMQLDNAIPIIPYYRGKDDDELLSLEEYLMKLKDVEDVRPLNREYFKLHEYTKFDSHEKLVAKLYSDYTK
jgi:CTD small phosphatase-like protein 2